MCDHQPCVDLYCLACKARVLGQHDVDIDTVIEVGLMLQCRSILAVRNGCFTIEQTLFQDT